MAKTIAQHYPRISDERLEDHGCLDETTLVPHPATISQDELKALIRAAIENANAKSSREIISISGDATQEQVEKIYKKKGRELFAYFRKYPGDPASTAHQIYRKNYRDVGLELFRNRTLQKERMNSGWRYQYLAVASARRSQRFRSISDIGAAEGDFNAVIDYIEAAKQPLSLYVSVKNRSNTMGGQDWPKAIRALEDVARNDKNRTGPYCCVFGIAMESGRRFIRREKKTGNPYSMNTEVWLSDFFWPFFSNYSYQEIMTLVLEVLVSAYEANELPTQIDVPDMVLDSFGECCLEAELVDELGNFHDPLKLVHFFCQPPAKKGKKK